MPNYAKMFNKLTLSFKMFYGKLYQNLYEINIDYWIISLKIISKSL